MFRKVLFTAGLLAATSFSSTSIAQTVLRFSNWLPPTHPITTEILQPWAANIKEQTDGRVEIQFLPALGKPPAHFDLVRDGVADMALSVQAYTADRFPSAYGMTLPGYADDAESAAVAYWRVHQKHFAELDEFKGVHLVGLYTHGPGHIFTLADKPVKKLDDVQGMRLRATGGVVQDMSNQLGIVPQFSSASEAYELLSRGVVDGVMFNSDSVVSFRMLPLMKNAYEIPGGLYRDTHYVIINNDAYNELDERDLKIFDAASGEAFARLAGKAWDKVDAQAWDKMREAGYSITTASEDDVARIQADSDVLKKAWVEKMAELGVDGEAALAMFRQEIAKVEAEK
ncbi:MAG TPA: ABC transporter substrate-binding protein [Pusillimonas sp.]|jgi:TRAP-type C4-dicarboxylate transport system substrate-binding protein|nr:ABC transporter substrate-binding protein [Pusillimonas sp.]MBC42608.1 ABC transporter substrate-binding protein [Pusillimonas sp.]HBT31377.1 ABC transporter substrate-binding protein [Pusillimonas sp.]|tara:strand:- start:15434 stop:16459 length:1026 start_codon:yes stop_codon:yes gene_type:complete